MDQEEQTHTDAAAADDEKIGVGCGGCMVSILLVAVAWAVGTYLGGQRLTEGESMELLPGGSHVLTIEIDNRPAYKGYHQVTDLVWEYAAEEGPSVLPLEIDVDNTDPWELAPDDMVISGPGGIPAPGQRSDIQVRLTLRPSADAPVAARGIVSVTAEIDYADWDLAETMASNVVGTDVTIYNKQTTLNQSFPVVVVDELGSQDNLWDRLSQILRVLGIAGIVIFGIVFAREAYLEGQKEEEATSSS